MDKAKQIRKDYENGKISFEELCNKASELPGIQAFVREARKRFECDKSTDKTGKLEDKNAN